MLNVKEILRYNLAFVPRASHVIASFVTYAFYSLQSPLVLWRDLSRRKPRRAQLIGRNNSFSAVLSSHFTMASTPGMTRSSSKRFYRADSQADLAKFYDFGEHFAMQNRW